jgi:hypothetical protein
MEQHQVSDMAVVTRHTLKRVRQNLIARQESRGTRMRLEMQDMVRPSTGSALEIMPGMSQLRASSMKIFTLV